MKRGQEENGDNKQHTHVIPLDTSTRVQEKWVAIAGQIVWVNGKEIMQ